LFQLLLHLIKNILNQYFPIFQMLCGSVLHLIFFFLVQANIGTLVYGPYLKISSLFCRAGRLYHSVEHILGQKNVDGIFLYLTCYNHYSKSKSCSKNFL